VCDYENPWLFQGQPFLSEDIGGSFGFVYRITNLKNGRKYIGRKYFWSKRKPRATVKNKSRRRVTTESDWKKYYGSCPELKDDLTKYGKESFSREIISLIARDENQHLAITQNILNKWKQGDDPEMKQIAKEEEEWVYAMFDRAVNEEKKWADYLFRDGSMIGLNDVLLQRYVEWIANRRMKAIGLKPVYDVAAKNNPLPWTQHWISSKGLQVAPQETEVESYIVGGIKQDVKKDTFSGFQL
jgi:hypothetical protein